MEKFLGDNPEVASQEIESVASEQDDEVAEIERKAAQLERTEAKRLADLETEEEPEPYAPISDKERSEMEALGRRAASLEARERHWRELQENSYRAELSRETQAYLMTKLVPEFILENPDKKLWVEDATVVELDVVDFTEKTEYYMTEEGQGKSGRGAQQVNRLIGNVFGWIDEEARPTKGEAVGFAGDAVTYVLRGESHRERALHFAAKVRETMADAKRNKAEVHISGGIASGPVLFGYLELDDKRNLPIVMGETVTNAKKLQGSATAGDVYIAKDLAESLPESARITRGSGIGLGQYENYEAIGQFAEGQRRREAENGPRRRPTFDDIERMAKFLHPRHNFDLRSEGLKMNLADGERQNASVAFVRLNNFRDTQRRIMEELSTTGYSATLEQFEDAVRQVNKLAHKHRMVLEKLVSDDEPKLVLFGQRTPPAAHAMRASTDILTALDKSGLDVSIGISSGRVYRGMTGAVSKVEGGRLPEPTKEELGFIGDSANVAAHFAASTPVGRIHADRRTLLDAEDSLMVEAEEVAGGQTLKGRKHLGQPWEIRRVENFGETLEHPSGARLVGREQQVELIDKTIEATIAEHKQRVVVVAAEAGEGKSLLTDTIITQRYLKQRNVEAFKGKSYSHSENESYQLWRGVVRKLFNVEDKDEPTEILQKIESALNQLDSAYGQYAPLIAENFRLAQVEVDDSQRFPGFVSKAAEIISQMLDKKSQDKPALVVFEDIHWADHPSLELLKYVLAKTQNSRVVYDLVMRPHPEKLEFLRINPECQVDVELGPLKKEDWADFILSHMPIKGMAELAKLEANGDTSWRRDLQSEVYSRIKANERLRNMTYELSDGNPYHGRSYLKWLAYYHEIYPDRINPKTGQPYQFLVPYGRELRIRDYIEERLLKDLGGTDEAHRDAFRSLDSRAQQVIKCAAKLRSFTLGDLADLVEMDHYRLAEILKRGQALDLVEDNDDLDAESYTFPHIKTWEAINNITGDIILTIEGREMVVTDEDLSRQAAELIKRKYGDDRLEDLARLYGSSSDYQQAIHYQILLGDRNFAREDVVHYGIAINSYREAIETFTKNFVEQNGTVDGAAQTRQEQENRKRRENWAKLGDAQHQHLISDFIEAHEKLARVYLQSGDRHHADALKAVERGGQYLERFAEYIQEPEVRINAELLMASIDTTARRFTNDIQGALVRSEQYADGVARRAENLLANESGHAAQERLAKNLASFYANYATCESKSNNWGKALSLYDRALGYAETAKDTVMQYRVASAKVWTLGRQGNVEEAIRLGEELLEISVRQDYKAGIPFIKSSMGEFYRRQGEWGAAKRYLREALEMARDWSPAQERGVYMNLVSVLEAEGDFDEALRVLDLMLVATTNGTETDDVGELEKRSRFAAERAFLLAKLERGEEAREVIQSIPLGQVQRWDTKGFVALAEALNMAQDNRGADDTSGETAQIRAKFDESVQHLKQGKAGTIHQVLTEYALWERTDGSGETMARQLLEDALAAAGERGEEGDANKIRALMHSSGRDGTEGAGD
jgi:class 3 adenylate cyclase/tetratricopeptide (TPR) repeat protein